MARSGSLQVTIAIALLAAGVGWFAGRNGPTVALGKEPRFPQLTMDQLNAEQRPLGEAIMKISAVGIGGPYNAMLRILPHPLTQTLALSRGVWYTKTAGETYKRERIGHHQRQ